MRKGITAVDAQRTQPEREQSFTDPAFLCVSWLNCSGNEPCNLYSTCAARSFALRICLFLFLCSQTDCSICFLWLSRMSHATDDPIEMAFSKQCICHVPTRVLKSTAPLLKAWICSQMTCAINKGASTNLNPNRYASIMSSIRDFPCDHDEPYLQSSRHPKKKPMPGSKQHMAISTSTATSCHLPLMSTMGITFWGCGFSPSCRANSYWCEPMGSTFAIGDPRVFRVFEPQRDFHDPRNNRPKREVLNQCGGPNSTTSTTFTSQAPTRRPEAEGGGSWTQTGRKDPRDPKSMSFLWKVKKVPWPNCPTTWQHLRLNLSKAGKKGNCFHFIQRTSPKPRHVPALGPPEPNDLAGSCWNVATELGSFKVRHNMSNLLYQHHISIYHIFRALLNMQVSLPEMINAVSCSKLNHTPKFPTARTMLEV